MIKKTPHLQRINLNVYVSSGKQPGLEVFRGRVSPGTGYDGDKNPGSYGHILQFPMITHLFLVVTLCYHLYYNRGTCR